MAEFYRVHGLNEGITLGRIPYSVEGGSTDSATKGQYSNRNVHQSAKGLLLTSQHMRERMVNEEGARIDHKYFGCDWHGLTGSGL